MKRLLFISWIFLLSVSFGLTKMKADVRMPLIFGDHMVLQQDTKIAIFGWADAGETVEVVFAGQKVKTTADTDGTWRVNLKPIKTKKEGQTLTIAGKNKLVYSDVLVGDVWVASGQSNMEWGIKVRKEYADDIAASEDPLLRLFFVPKNTSLEPLTDIEVPQGTSNPERAARWVLCTPEMLAKINGQGFSATAYYFARDMRAANGRPLGVIQSAWGGTRAEAWTSLSGLKQEPALAHYVAAYEKNVKDNPEIVIDLAKKWKGESKEVDWIIKHGCRTLLKQGIPEVMELFGFDSIRNNISVEDFQISSPKVKVGDSLEFGFNLLNHSNKTIKIRLEYGIYYQKANGTLTKKVHKISEKEYAGNSTTRITRKHSFRVVTTRKFHLGLHQIAIIINGSEFEKYDFVLIE